MLRISRLASFFSPFSPSVEFFSCAPGIQTGKWNALAADTTSIFGVFKHLCTIIRCAAAGQSIATVAIDSLVDLGAITPPAVRTAFPNPNCQKPEATLLHHNYALDSPASCDFLENLFLIPGDRLTIQLATDHTLRETVENTKEKGDRFDPSPFYWPAPHFLVQ